MTMPKPLPIKFFNRFPFQKTVVGFVEHKLFVLFSLLSLGEAGLAVGSDILNITNGPLRTTPIESASSPYINSTHEKQPASPRSQSLIMYGFI